MNTKQSKAQQLADALDAVNTNNADSLLVQMTTRSAATELRRLHAENEALRKDAERYRWLAWTSDTQLIVIYEIGTGQILFGNKANDVIDAAMQKGQP